MGKNTMFVYSLITFCCYIDNIQERQPKFMYHKRDYDATNMNRIIDYSDNINTVWKVFTSKLKFLAEKYIFKTKPILANRRPRPVYMNEEAISKVKKQE